MNPPHHPYDLLASELRLLAETDGRELWRNRIRLTGLLLDAQPDLRREIRAIVSAVEQGVADALSDTERTLSAIAIDRQASLLETESGLRSEIALNVTRTIAHALNLGPLPSVYGNSQPLPPPPVQLERAYHPPLPPPPAPPAPPPDYSTQPQVPLHGWSDPRDSQGYSGYSEPRRRFPWAPLILGIAVLAAGAIVLVPQLTRDGPAVDNKQVAKVDPVRPAQPNRTPPSGGWANEEVDYGIPRQNGLRDAVGGTTPISHPYAGRVTTGQLQSRIASTPNIILIDVLAQAHASTLPNAFFLPAAGQPGNFTDPNQLTTEKALQALTSGNKSAPLVFFCLGVACWESYNAAIRAYTLGYSNIYWYRGGIDAWQAAGLPMMPLPPNYAAP